MRPDDVVISVGSIYKAITGSSGIPSENGPALRMALGLRTVAIRIAREKELSGFVLTSNGSRANLDRLVAETGSPGVKVLKMTEAEACKRISKLVPAGARREACELGIKSRWFARYTPGPDDVEVTP